MKQHDTATPDQPVTRTADAPPRPFDADMTDAELLAKYVELERFTEAHGESFADGFVRVMHKKAVLLRMQSRERENVLRDALERLRHNRGPWTERYDIASRALAETLPKVSAPEKPAVQP